MYRIRRIELIDMTRMWDSLRNETYRERNYRTVASISARHISETS